jgi:hypothetical protein
LGYYLGVSTPERNDFKLEMTFTGKGRDYSRPIGVVFVIIGITVILMSMTSNLASDILPMNDDYLQVLVPSAPDGKEPLALKTLDQQMTDSTVSITGTVLNRTDFPISGLDAEIQAMDASGHFKTVEVPLTPSDIPSQGTGSFQATVTLDVKPSSYSLQFKLADGPEIPHRDDRAPDAAGPAAK